MAIVNMLPGGGSVEIPSNAFPALFLFDTETGSDNRMYFTHDAGTYGKHIRTGGTYDTSSDDNQGIYFIPLCDLSCKYKTATGSNQSINLAKGKTYIIKLYFKSSDSKYYFIIKEDGVEIVNVSSTTNRWATYLLTNIEPVT